jgi:peptidyl-prolyl cis-trans isomerase D
MDGCGKSSNHLASIEGLNRLRGERLTSPGSPDMSPLGKFTLRLVIYGAVIAYLTGDLCVFKGPLRRGIDHTISTTLGGNANARSQDIVARVFDYQITRSQLDRAVRESLWFEGKSMEALTPIDRKAALESALDALIDHELLRVKAGDIAASLKVSDEEIQERLERFRTRFESADAMASAMKSQGIASMQDLRNRLAARIQQEKYVASEIDPLVRITDDEARQWFEENQQQLAWPERIEARHVFIPTLDHPPDVAKAKLAAALADLTEGRRDFATLVKEISEDSATKDHGGSLGWMTRARLPADFAAAVFPLAIHQPTLVRTRLGWHLVEVTGRKPAAPRTFDQAQPEILAALEAVKRRHAITEFRAALRKSAAANIQVFQDMLAE